MISLKGAGYDERGARAYIGSLRAQPLVGSRAKDPGQGIRGLRPPEANDILYNET